MKYGDLNRFGLVQAVREFGVQAGPYRKNKYVRHHFEI